MPSESPTAPGPARGLPAVALAALGTPGSPVGEGGLTTGLVIAGAGVLLVAAVAVALALRARRRRRHPEPAHEPVALPERAARAADAPRSASAAEAGQRAIGYTTFPDRKLAVSPESRYQARRIEAACEAHGLVLHQLVGDVQSYSGPDLERPGLNHAVELLAGGEATCLVVTGLDRLSRSAANLGTVIDWLAELDARLVVIDIDLDTDNENGRLAARALARVGALERRQGRTAVHVVPDERPASHRGRPAVSDLPLLQRRIATMRASGMTLQAIADTLNREGVPTLRGGAEWRPSSVQAATGYKRPGRGTSNDRAPDDDAPPED